MFVQGNKRAECSGGQQREHDAVTGPVPPKHLTLHQRLICTRAKLLTYLFLSLSERERPGLCKIVGKENTMVLGVADRVVRCARDKEVCGNELGTLVEKLVERVLSVGTRCSPDDGLGRKW